jgi:hypothetical protein
MGLGKRSKEQQNHGCSSKEIPEQKGQMRRVEQQNRKLSKEVLEQKG